MTYEELDATVAAKKDSEDLSETSYTRSTRSGNQLQLSAKFETLSTRRYATGGIPLETFIECWLTS
jgi:hypothetical protein